MTRSEQKRADILQAALDEFAAHGYEGANVDRITERAGVSKRTVYRHFSSKEELFDTICAELFAQAVGAGEATFVPDANVREQLVAIALQMLEVRAAPSFLKSARVLFLAGGRMHSQARELLLAGRAQGGGTTAWFREAAAAGALDLKGLSPEEVSLQLNALLTDFTLWPQIIADLPAPNAEERERLAANAVDLILARYSRSAP